MDRQILSQEEINALLRENDSNEQLSPLQKDALGEIGNISYGSASTALSDILKKRVVIDTPTVRVTNQKEIKEAHPVPYVIVEVNYKKGLSGSNVLILKVSDSAVIADLMMGGDGSNPSPDLSEMELSAVGEAMNQMVGSACTSLSTLLSKRIDIDPPLVEKVNLSEDKPFIRFQNMEDLLVVVSFRMKIEELIDSEIMLLMPFPLAVDLADSLLALTEGAAHPVHEAPAQPVPQAATEAIPAPSQRSIPPQPQPIPEVRQPQVMVQPAQFSPLGAAKTGKEAVSGNIGLIMDVPLQVTVELGSTRMKIKEILELGLGSIIELEKLAGDPVDVLVNGKLIAKGEVVVIDENFGIKITDIISPIERATTLQ
ncbi:flagellar motor switch protein FliN/FliY [Hydrogenispora ethanolica]|jgi:flagellar motor switch protein FliN/FliY|uniref:Flagellar motor switch protein FliN/FliY n=1 Tax=Hydrogenispora ethanolica TaxID=1082276 RepID=A0A4R1RK56_HYDET|nr:flagellar motor switch phosphatase FliY [Hydrogenispora ethanolica]TCL66554.1 flagellar motor switch protein FliN/FliY [Hydrogenispora ethanolica]